MQSLQTEFHKHTISLFQQNARSLYTVDFDREEIWKVYLESFPADTRQSHNCNACRSFLTQYGGLVIINGDFLRIGLWDFVPSAVNEEYYEAIKNLSAYIRTRPISSVFITSEAMLGTPNNVSLKMGVRWYHLCMSLPSHLRSTYGAAKINAQVSEANSAYNSLRAAYAEITPEALTTVRELIRTNELYRGQEFKQIVETFSKEYEQFKELPAPHKENFLWVNCGRRTAVNSIRSTVIGTLLLDLSKVDNSDDEAVDRCVRSFERKMGQYNRPQAVVTETGAKKLEELIVSQGYGTSLERRLALYDDLNSANTLFVNRATRTTKSPLEVLRASATVDAKKLTPSEVLTVEQFLNSPYVNQDIELYMCSSLEPNLFCLTVPKDPTSKGLFKWGNSFAWSYRGGVADGSLKERVAAAGGKTEGLATIRLGWRTDTDLDLRVREPSYLITFGSAMRSPHTQGELDVDAQASTIVENPVENIVYPFGARLAPGRKPVQSATLEHQESITTSAKPSMSFSSYFIEVNVFRVRTPTSEFTVEVEIGGETFTYGHNQMLRGKQTVRIAELRVFEDGTMLLIGMASSNSPGKTVWGLGTKSFHKVKALLKSPNFWPGEPGQGNRHLFFALEGCNPGEERIAPFYNEQLKPELLREKQLKRAFEVLSSRMEAERVEGEPIAGVGFSTSTKNSVLLRAQGRIIQVNMGDVNDGI